MRARREIAEGDVVVFADGPHDQAPRQMSFNDLDEPAPSPALRQDTPPLIVTVETL